MYNKIGAIILNSAKAAGLSDVFVSQPDAVKENLAGKIFILAEIGGKKAEGKKIFDFLKMSLDDNYYNDEKIIFRDKIEGLKLENIFEAAVAKTNRDLNDFLVTEKIKINPDASSISLGLIYQNKLHFANFGRNRALLIHRRGENYELINVEANAAEAISDTKNDSEGLNKTPQLFSSLISGEIPAGSYFIFTSEALPEYLSGSEMIKIVTKLPPLTAAAQIRNTLASINTYVPFLGIIIKNTVGLAQEELREDYELVSSSAQGSISSLNYTEQKTEEMLAPAGLINFSSFFKRSKNFLKEYFIPSANRRLTALKNLKKNLTLTNKESILANAQPEPTPVQESLEKMTYPAGDILEMGKIRSLDAAKNHNLKSERNRDSFLIKEKMIFKKKSGWILAGLKKVVIVLGGAMNPRFWPAALKKFSTWISGLSRQRLWLGISLTAFILIFTFSMALNLHQKKQEVIAKELSELLAVMESKESSIDFYLLYNNEAGALRSLVEAQTILESWPKDNKEQRAAYELLSQKLQVSAEKVQRIERIAEAELVRELNDDKINNLSFAKGKMYAAGEDIIKEILPNGNTTEDSSTTVGASPDLKRPFFDGENTIYYWNKDRPLAFNLNTKRATPINPATALTVPETPAFKFYSRYFYTLAPEEDQIHRYNHSNNNIGAKTDWLTESLDLNQASDLYVDGNIYVLNKNGQVFKLYLNKPVDFKSAPLSPLMSAADKLLLSNRHIYFFDAPSKRLAVLNKEDGSLLKQYLLEFAQEPQDFTFDEENGLIYILDNGSLYKFAINH